MLGRKHTYAASVRNGWKADIVEIDPPSAIHRICPTAQANHLIDVSSALYACSMIADAPDGSRDRRIEDPTNLWIIHPAARALLPWFVSRGISANAVSVAGLCLG